MTAIQQSGLSWRIGIAALCFGVASTSVYADVYRWVDKESGEIFFSETPPPPEVTSEYENVTHKLKKKTLERGQTASEAQVSTNSKTTNSKPIIENDNSVISDEALLILRRCQNFLDQISRLEKTIPETRNPDTMDRLVVKLVEYEKSFNQQCK